MNLPPSSLLGRLEAFLPEMEKANQKTEKLAQEGKLEVLDGSLEVADSDKQTEGAEGTDDEAGDSEVEEEEEGGQAEGAAGVVAAGGTVQLDFALGDFDDTPIAKMEQDKEAAASEAGGVDAGVRGSAEEEHGVEEGRGVVVPGAAHPKKPSKPLIEEL
ncbi:unnamed protein product [Ectocarpus sp. 12 AP-2014]